MTIPLVEVRDLQVRRGRRVVLSVDQLALAKGEVLAVVGPNGAGKSTLLLTLARLLRPQRGEIYFNGQSVTQESDLKYRRRVALVLQDPLLFDMTVFDNVATGLRFRRLGKKQITATVEKWLTRLDIYALRERRAINLSGGEAQRVSLARALVLEPQLLLLDEPFSALDPPTHKRLITELATLLTETGTTTVLVTHDLEEAVKLGQRIGVILGNQLKQVGTLAQLSCSSDAKIRAFIAGAD